MSVRLKLISIIALVALVPPSVSAATMLGVHQRAFQEQLIELHAKSAQYGAEAVESSLGAAISSLRPLVETSIRWPDLTGAEMDGALWLLYGQLRAATAVWVSDATRSPLQPAAYLRPDEVTPGEARNALAPEEFQRLLAVVPIDAALQHQLAIGDVITLGPESEPVLPITFSVLGAGQQRWFVHVAISLLDTCTELGAKRPAGTSVHLVDVRGRFVCKPDALLSSVDPLLARPVSGVRAGIRYERADGEAMLAAVARAPWGFQVIAEQSQHDAFAASRQIRDESALSIAAGALAAILAGLLLARSIHGPVQRLAHGAEQVARGEFSHRLPESGNDELAELSRTFNRMSQEIEKRDREIRAWNEELRQRVEERTSELKQAQVALLESRKIAALASLGAGVAHEINNPLTGVIGLTQLLKSRLRDPKESELLGAVEHEALRIRDIVQRMQVLSHVQEQRGYGVIAPDAVLDRLLDTKRTELEAASIALERPSTAIAARVRGNSGELEQALHEILDNALKAMRGRSGTLRIASELLEDELYKLSIADSGHGIAPENLERVFEPFFTTKSDWQGKGLGLTLAYRVIEAHSGTIRLQSALGEGTTVTITLPLARRDSHLA